MNQIRCDVNQLNLKLFPLKGGASTVWLVAWIFLAFDSPSRHPRITDIEREYIEHGTRKSEAPKKVKPKLILMILSVTGNIQIQRYTFISDNSRCLFTFGSINFTYELIYYYASRKLLFKGSQCTLPS